MKNDDRYEELIGDAIRDALKDDCESMDFYQDIKYIEPDIKKYSVSMMRRSSNLKYIAVAASIMIIFVLSGTFAVLISNGSVSATGFNIEKQFVVLKNIFPKGNEDNNKYIEDDTIVQEIQDLNDIKKATEFFPDLFIPEKVPDRFIFESLTIKKTVNNIYDAVYIYKDKNDGILTVGQQTVPKDGFSMYLVGVTKEIKTDDGTICISEDPFGDGGNSVNYTTEEYSVSIAGSASVDEIMAILNQ